MTTHDATTSTWDLSDLYSGIDDPKVGECLDARLRRAQHFAEGYRGKINSPDLTAELLRNAVQEYESILQEAEKPLDFASLVFSADTGDPAHGAFLQMMRERHSEITVRMLFMELELMAVPDEQMDRLLESPVLSGYAHYITAERLFRAHRLSEPEERILEETANTGRRAFTRLFEETVSNSPFEMTLDGLKRTMTFPEIVALQRDPDREVRKASASGITQGLSANSRLLTYLHNTLLQDKAVDDRLRKYEFPEQARHISNELDRETVELVVRTVMAHYPLMARYYRLKREILGCDKLMHYDRYAPLFSTKREIPFEAARDIVLASFSRFSPVLGELAGRFFEHSWIDAAVRPGKQAGAYCSYVTPDLHPYVFVNYLNRMDDVMTLGHELGHAVHACLAGKHGFLSFSPTLPVAELASTFGEILVFEALQKESDGEEKLALYAEKIEGAFGTIFRQAAMYRFEQAIHARRREKGELTTEQFGEVWQSCQQETFGDSLELGEEHKLWWMYVPHFVNWPFYVYAYAFGELLVMSLYAMHMREGDSFVPKFIALLEAGGSKPPTKMLADAGMDIRDARFWEGGLQVLEGFVDRFEEMYRQTGR